MKIKHLITIFLIAALIAAASGCLSAKPKDNKPVEITFSAASSLQDAMKDAGAQFAKNHPEVKINFNFAASGVLEKQIEQGAPVDLFASASQKEIDLLEQKGLIIKSTRINFTRNKLVIIAPSRLTIEELKNLDKIAAGDPKTVPAGRYIDGDFDLEVEMPSHAFERLDIKQQQIIQVSLKKSAIHIIKE